MNNFNEYTIVFSASVAIPKGEKLGLGTLLENLTKRLETAGHEKFLVGNTSIHATYNNDTGEDDVAA
jgi:hypothetical protein